MFKKRNRNFRGRRKDSASDDDQMSKKPDQEDSQENGNFESAKSVSKSAPQSVDTTTSTITSNMQVKKVKKKKEKETPMSKSSSILSFQQDEGDDMVESFKIKKPTHSKRVAKQLKKILQKEKEEEESRATPPTVQYTTEVLQELKMEQTEENGIRTVSPGPGSDIDFTDEEEPEEPTFKDLIQSGQIPDASLIHAIRKRRQIAREQGDFIALDDTVKAETDKSRLIREDENDVSDEDGERLNFTVAPDRETELRHIQQTIIQAHDESHSDGSDHDWEVQQIRKGVSIPKQHMLEGNQDSPSSYQQYLYGNQDAAGFHMGGPQPFYGSVDSTKRIIPTSDLPKINISLIKKRLAERLEEMQSVHRAHENERIDLTSRLDSSQTIITDSSGNKERLENQYRFFQEMRGYVTDLVECLNEKVPMINHLEKGMLKLWQKRSEKKIERRQQDVKDEATDCMLSFDKSKTVDPSTQDEEKMRRFAEREARRNRRRRLREARGSAAQHEEGLSSDDEQNPSELAHFNTEKDRLKLETTRLFEDVESDFCELGAIKKHFERWRNEECESYHEAYIALCLPKLFTPFVKLKLLDWNPLEKSCLDLTVESWYESLLFYGHKEGREITRKDDDLKLMPNIVEKMLLPKLTVLVKSAWDPLSSRQTHSLVTSVTYFISNYPTLTSDSKHTKALIKAVVERMRRTLDDDVFMPLYPKQLLENKGPACAFFNRQLWQCYKLLCNILLWHGIVEQSALMEMALDALLNRYITLGLQNSPLNDTTLHRCQLIASKFPKAWFGELGDSDCTLPQLESFCRFLMQSARVAHQLATTTGKESELKNSRDKIKQIAKILVNIHAMDHSMELATQYSLKLQRL